MASLEKLQGCPQIPCKIAPMHPSVAHLLNLLKNEGQSGSILEDLATAVGCVNDEDEAVTSNVDQIMLPLVHAMMSCSDYKVRDMGHRQELKFVVDKKVYGCPHRPSDEIIKHSDYAVTLRLKQFQGGNLSAVQNALDNSLKTTFKLTCNECNQENMLRNDIIIRMKRSIQPFCDPDFLTIFFDNPKNLLENDLLLQFGQSSYAVKVVTQWDEERQKSAVSVQRSDGWWWHGIDMEQASHYKYSEKQRSVCNPFSKAIVLMCVRVVPYADYEGNSEDMEDLMDIENNYEEINSVDKDVDSAEVSDECDILGHYGKDERDQFIRNDLIDGENQKSNRLREGHSNPDQSYNFDAAASCSQVNDERAKNQAEKTRSKEPSLVNADIQFQRDMAKAQAVSRKETPGCLTAMQAIRLGIRVAARLGILCRKPDLPLDGNSFVPMDGNCIFSCFIHALFPTLRGAEFKQATWELRIKAVGSAIEMLKQFNDEQWDVLQAIVTGNDKETLSKEEIRQELVKYMESGKYIGNVGDILPQLAADFLGRTLLVIEIEKCKVTSMSLVEPGAIFGTQHRDDECPVFVVLQMNHYDPLLIAEEAKETAKNKCQEWNKAGRVGVTAEGEFVDSFDPTHYSTPREQQGKATSRNEQDLQSDLNMGDPLHNQSTGQVMNIFKS